MKSTFWHEIKHIYGVQKNTKQNFGTYEHPIWALNSNSETFLYCQTQNVTFISDQSLYQKEESMLKLKLTTISLKDIQKTIDGVTNELLTFSLKDVYFTCKHSERF